MGEMIELLRETFRGKAAGKTEMQPKSGIHTAKDTLLHAMPAHVRVLRVAGVKRVGEYPGSRTELFLYGTIFVAPPQSVEGDSRNVYVFAEGQADRSPTGTGVSARLALHYARGEIELGETHTVASIMGNASSRR